MSPSQVTTDEPPAIRIRNVRKRYARLQVLDGLDLEISRGEFFGLVGMNGAGKTTCIKGLLDFTNIDDGELEIFGVPHRETRARETLAFVPERFLPPYYLSGRDFLDYMGRLHGRQTGDDERREMCEKLDLDIAALAKSVRDYSKGMAQKLGLVACFLSDKQLFVLDEPMSGLDPKARLLVKRHLQSCRDQGSSILMSTHLLSDVDALCDRLGILHGGKLRFVGSPEECRRAFASETLEEAYLNCISQ